ncbi:hypothetical protein PZA11_002195 [Diplocarpon coronariae]
MTLAISIDKKEAYKLYAKLLPFLYNLVIYFFKSTANTLPLLQLINYKIKFEGLLLIMKTAYLYKMSEPEFEKIREYLINNLKKGFI